LRQFRQQHQSDHTASRHDAEQNVGDGERMVSAIGGGILVLQGLAQRNLAGALAAAVGGSLIFRGIKGHCSLYQRLGIDTKSHQKQLQKPGAASGAVHIVESFLINKSREELYNFWRNFENFLQFMSHLESVRKIDDTRSHWVAKAPKIYGGQVEWDAEVTADETNSRIAWRALPGADVEHRGSVRFQRANGDRGTLVRVELEYYPPAGVVGRYAAKLFGEEPEQQIREDLRRMKRLLEIGEVPTTEGQPRGTCLGHGRRESA
jgi:uncharacterized membrane protein